MHSLPQTDCPVRQSARRRGGFTLVELLVVIAVIAILAAIAVPAAGKAFEVMKSKDAQSTAVRLVQAIEAYEQEWNIVPNEWKENEDEMKDTDEVLMDPLMGNDGNGINRTGERYFEDDTVDAPINGIVVTGSGDSASYKLFDPWGTLYEYTVDDGDGEIDRPSDYNSTTPLFKTAIVHSAGPDQDFSETGDNPNTWGD